MILKTSTRATTMRPHLQLLRASFAAFILCAMTHVVVALEKNGFVFTENGAEATITGYTGAGGAVAIPASLNGKSVVAISDRAFDDKTNLTSVTIPSSVTSIGEICVFCMHQPDELNYPLQRHQHRAQCV